MNAYQFSSQIYDEYIIIEYIHMHQSTEANFVNNKTNIRNYDFIYKHNIIVLHHNTEIFEVLGSKDGAN